MTKKQRDSLDFNGYVNWLNLIQDKNEEYFNTTEKLRNFFVEYSDNFEHKETLNSIFQFHLRLDSLKNTIINLSESDDLYSIQIIYRCYLEHWLKATYIWVRYLKEKTNDVGNEYNSIGRIGEDLQYGFSIKHVDELINAEKNNLDVWDVMSKYKKSLKGLDKKSITKNIDNFKYKNLAKYLLDNNAPGGDWVSIIIPEYSELSSFVHGGPSALNIFKSKVMDKRFENYKGMVRFSFHTSKAFAYALFVLIYGDKKFKGIKLSKKEVNEYLPLLFSLQEKDNFPE